MCIRDRRPDRQLLLPRLLGEVDGAGRAGLLAGAAFRAAAAGETASGLGQRLLLGEAQTDLLPARPALLRRDHPHLLARPAPAPAELQVRDLRTVPLHRPDVEQLLAPQVVVDAPSGAGTGRDRLDGDQPAAGRVPGGEDPPATGHHRLPVDHDPATRDGDAGGTGEGLSLIHISGSSPPGTRPPAAG